MLTIFSTFFVLNILLGIVNLTSYPLHVEEFLSGVHTGIAATLLIPIYINFKLRQKLKQQQLFHE
ncbi:hypothetical protein AAFN87_03975 [Solibacillus sp. CAU 1738]